MLAVFWHIEGVAPFIGSGDVFQAIGPYRLIGPVIHRLVFIQLQSQGELLTGHQCGERFAALQLLGSPVSKDFTAYADFYPSLLPPGITDGLWGSTA